MLKPTQSKRIDGCDSGFVIIASRYNARYVDAMLRASQAEFRRAHAKFVRVLRVPGAYEIPVVAARLAREGSIASPGLGAIVCLGVILRGETVHAAHIGEAVSRALMEIQVRHELPIVHEVLLLENEAQARARCLGKTHNRGTEAAQTALQMAHLFSQLSPGHSLYPGRTAPRPFSQGAFQSPS